ncbi:MAG: hypothetical protein IKQ72_12755 [Bacteroidaceae bacterium]|nr:hypothetical protein [Bacteroidaceae bacterium]
MTFFILRYHMDAVCTYKHVCVLQSIAMPQYIIIFHSISSTPTNRIVVFISTKALHNLCSTT